MGEFILDKIFNGLECKFAHMLSGKFESSGCLRGTCLSSFFFVLIFVGKHKTSELQIVLVNFTTKQAILHLPVGIIINNVFR